MIEGEAALAILHSTKVSATKILEIDYLWDIIVSNTHDKIHLPVFGNYFEVEALATHCFGPQHPTAERIAWEIQPRRISLEIIDAEKMLKLCGVEARIEAQLAIASA